MHGRVRGWERGATREATKKERERERGATRREREKGREPSKVKVPWALQTTHRQAPSWRGMAKA
jgi:hypothetical protein